MVKQMATGSDDKIRETVRKGYADIAQRENLTKVDQLNYLNIISEESSKLSNLIKEIGHLPCNYR